MGLKDLEWKVLDHGFIKVIDTMGVELDIVNAARVSYGGHTNTAWGAIQDADIKLLRFLLQNQHTSPFEMCEIKLHIKLPIFVMRQLVRHRTASLNEVSARYTEFKSQCYVPSKRRLAPQCTINKQGSGAASFSNITSDDIIQLIKNANDNALDTYNKLLAIGTTNDAASGLARELARTVLPVSCYTEVYWKIDLNNLLRFMKLRGASNAQYEIQEYAKVMEHILELWMPAVYNAFLSYVKHSKVLSLEATQALNGKISSELLTRTDRDTVEGLNMNLN